MLSTSEVNLDRLEIAAFKGCNRCGGLKPLTDFALEPRVKSGRTATCRACTTQKHAAYRLAHPDKVKESHDRYAKKFPDRVQQSKAFVARREKLERREKRLALGMPTIEPKTTNEGRLCSSCRRRKHIDEFPPNRPGLDGLSCYCRDCCNRKAREQAQKPATKAYRQDYMRRLALKKYGLTLEAFNALADSQNGKCAICEEGLKYGTGGCAVDHDHDSGAVRGILCRLCNVGIGHFKENADILTKAIQYLAASSLNTGKT